MELITAFENLSLGFHVALSLQNLAFCFFGVLVGTAIGVLPGVGPVATMALLLPATYYLPPAGALIMLAGIYYGAQYGGSTTAILVNLPGEASSVVTCIDGHAMAKKGRAGPALAIAALGSFFAGTVATLAIALLAVPLSQISNYIGPAEYFSLMALGLVTAIVLAHGSVLKACGMVFLGLLLGIVGTDRTTGLQRFTFDMSSLFDGIDFVILSMGLFGIAEIISNIGRSESRDLITKGLGKLMPSRDDFRRAFPAAIRGTVLGGFLGILPGGGATLSSFASYSLEKKLSKRREEFGKGAVEGVAGPESANNAAAQTSFIPMLTLGLPSNVVMAMMIGGMMVHGITPGPRVMVERPDLFWGMIASMWVGNVMLLVLNLPLIGLWIRLLSTPYRLLGIAILFFCCIGVYSLNNNATDVGLMALFGVVGYVFAKLGCEPAPLLLGFVLGGPMEVNMRRAMLFSDGSMMTFITSPLSLAFLLFAAIILASVLFPKIKQQREEVFQE
ncbi:tripartite tricarboxylate transporter permease [Xanthobacter sp. DSM 24535]|uniref:tripartite tricarboxylate transporter permease n=1 Tax=Roseixanthobacter psychrophilus TaxID=3119917 RepID=UPI0037281A76